MGSSSNSSPAVVSPQGSSVFSAETWLASPIEEVFEFHRDPANARQIMQPWTKCVSITREGPAIEGTTFEFSLREFHVVPLKWVGIWETVEEPTLLIDSGDQCPFPFFRHEHRFTAVSGGTKLLDQITFIPPGPGFLRPFTALGVRGQLAATFRWRRYRMEAIFGALSRGSAGGE